MKTITFAFSLLAMADIMAAQQSQQAPTFNPSALPERLRFGGGSGATIRNGFQAGSVTWRASATGADIRWTSSPLTNSEPDWDTYSENVNLGNNSRGNAKYQTAKQAIQTAFYVTAIGREYQDSLLVAGVKKVGGQVIVQRWEFFWPLTGMPNPVEDFATGLESVEIVIPGLQKTTLYTSVEINGDPTVIVSGICGLRGPSGSSPTHAVLQFVAPNDIKLMNLTTGNITLLASESGSGGALGVVPSLSIKKYSGISIKNHSALGYVYFFSTGSSAVSDFYGGAGLDDDDVRTHLVDSDRNGTIDSALELSTNQAQAAGYLTLENYFDWWLE